MLLSDFEASKAKLWQIHAAAAAARQAADPDAKEGG